MWFVYLYVVVFGAGLGVSSLPRYGSNDVWQGYVENQYPREMLFLPVHGLGTVDHYRNYLDALDLTRVVMAPYVVHR
jgi:hypothetical protein